MTLLQKIKDLANEKNISLAELERITGLSSGSISKWEKSSPSVDKLKKIADFFNVSLDYLSDRGSQDNADEFATFFRINTEGLNDEQKADFEKEMKRFMKYVRQTFDEDED